MKASELIKELNEGATVPELTCDTVKAGNAEKEVKKIAVSMFATVDIIRKVKEWGADMLIIHEPIFYNHLEIVSNETDVIRAKRALIEESGILIYRYHDNMHYRDLDSISEGELHYLGLKGKLEKTQYFASSVFISDDEVSALELARRMKNDLGIAHPRIAGSLNAKGKRIAACFGTPNGVFELLQSDDVDIVLTGEICEWMLGEYARDAAALGMNKALIVMGHIGSERDGMRLLVEKLNNKHADLDARYFECGEVYSYVD